jgi:hypothetical protein
MTLDLDFARELILKIDAWQPYEPQTNRDLTDSDTPIGKINAYLDLFVEEQLISAKKTTYIDGSISYQIKYLTFKGKQFALGVANPNLWGKYKEQIVKTGLSFFGDIVMRIILAKIL